MGAAKGMGDVELFEPEDADAALCEVVAGRGTHRSEADDDDIEGGHGSPTEETYGQSAIVHDRRL
jgi:hypothetical protein